MTASIKKVWHIYPLRHYHGVSIFLEVYEAQKSLDEMFHGFSIDLSKLRENYRIKVVELLLYLNVLCVENIKENKPYYDKTQMEKIPHECCS